MIERDSEKDKKSTYEEIQEQLLECQDFISSLRDISVMERGSEIVHYIKTHDLEKPPNSSLVKEALRRNKIDSEPEFDEDYVIDLDFRLNETSINFIQETNNSKFTNYRKLSLRNISSLYNQGMKELNKFFDRSTPNVLQILYLHGGEKIGKSTFPDVIPV